MASSSNKDVGTINTAFLTCKLPAWAGVRQNVVGSDIQGLPVKPTNFSTSRFSSSASSGGSSLPESSVPLAEPLPASAFTTHHVDLVQSTAATLLQLTSKIDALTEKVTNLESNLTVLYTTLAEPDAMEEEES